MSTGNSKNVLTIVLVAILSSVITLFGYNYLNRKNSKQIVSKKQHMTGRALSSVDVDSQHLSSFNQDPNIHLTSMTTEDGYPDFTEASERSIHCVVHVKTKSIRQEQVFNPFEWFFGYGNRAPETRPQEQYGFGSGVIISKDGYIITNNHVVKGATEVNVSLNDNRELEAKVIGTDPQTDIALLKIEGDDFPYLPFGNSDDLKVGEWVLAVGNPFNLTSTVTAGIVSAKNRSNVVGNMGIQSFIQIDAAVNRGNSGGALVNTRGELVGINTAIYSQNGSFAGYGFAIPISIAGKVAADIKQYGSTQRALLGIQAPNVEAIRMEDPKKAKELSKIRGVLVEDFAERSAAKAAGLEKGDIIVGINNASIKNFAELQNQISRYRPGDKIQVKVKRGNAERTFTVELQNDEGSTELTKKTHATKKLGATFKNIPENRKRQLGISSGIEVASVDNKGLFRKNGIDKGFIIMRIDRMPINSESDIANIVETVRRRPQDQVITITGFYPRGRTQYIAIDLSN